MGAFAKNALFTPKCPHSFQFTSYSSTYEGTLVILTFYITKYGRKHEKRVMFYEKVLRATILG